MPKFNKPAPPRVPDTRTHEGGPGFTRGDARDELFLLGMANAVGENTFYEKGVARDKRFIDLIIEVTKLDPAWVCGFLPWLRREANMRSAPIVGAAEYVRAGGPHGRQLVAAVLQRPDEPAELLSYWRSAYGRHVPMPIKRGIADALPRLYTERNTLRYDGSMNAMRFGDVIEIVHPSPNNEHQSALYKHLIDRRHGRGELGVDTPLGVLMTDKLLLSTHETQRRANLQVAIETGWDWKRIAGWVPGGMDAEAWEAAIPNMGLMALVRNLRNFDEAGISRAAVESVQRRLTDRDEVRKSRQFPMRFLSAWKNVTSLRWGDALETALAHSIDNIPALPGRSLVLVDLSPSMDNPMLSAHKGRRDGVSPDRWEAAALFGYAIAQRSPGAEVVLFDMNPIAHCEVSRADSILRLVESTKQHLGNGTDILSSLAQTYTTQDRVIILTDEQTGYPQVTPTYWSPRWFEKRGGFSYSDRCGWDKVAHIRCPVITFNLAGYVKGVTPNERNWLTIGGLTDACFGVIESFDHRRRRGWPWEVTQAAQSPAEEVRA